MRGDVETKVIRQANVGATREETAERTCRPRVRVEVDHMSGREKTISGREVADAEREDVTVDGALELEAGITIHVSNGLCEYRTNAGGTGVADVVLREPDVVAAIRLKVDSV